MSILKEIDFTRYKFMLYICKKKTPKQNSKLLMGLNAG